MNTKKGWIFKTSLAIVGVLVIGYFAGCYYYHDHFLAHTQIAGINIGRMTPQKASDHVQKDLDQKTVTLTEAGKVLKEVKPSQYGLNAEIKGSLDQALAQQNKWKWPLSIVPSAHTQIQLQFNEAQKGKMADLLKELGINNKKRPASENARLVKNKKGNQLKIEPEKDGKQVSPERLGEALAEALSQVKNTVALEQAYQLAEIRQDDPSLTQKITDYQKVIGSDVKLLVEDKEYPIKKEDIQDWVLFDNQLKMTVDKKKISAYLKNLNQKIAGLLIPHEFQSTLSGQVTIVPGIYGWHIDRDKAVDQVAEAVLSGEGKTFEPAIAGKGYKVPNFFGDTYIEVDIPHQKLFFYEKGEKTLETDVITGQDKSPTVPGANEIWNMQSPSVLKANSPITGIPYAQPVDYWMAFDYHAEGIHDAQWQPAFGGQLYRNMAGSYGCVNTSIKIMPTIYSKSYIGLPVIIFNEESLH